jgi:ribonuclease VapC
VIVADASAILAIFFGEPDSDRYEDCLARAGEATISAVNYWEVLVRAHAVGGDAGRQVVVSLLSDLRVRVEPCDGSMADSAAAAFARFRGRPSRLNLGDSFAYALAQKEGDGLLYKGRDFPETDIKSALD